MIRLDARSAGRSAESRHRGGPEKSKDRNGVETHEKGATARA